MHLAAVRSAVTGDDQAFAVASFRAGDPRFMEMLLASKTIEPGSPASRLLFELVSGTFKRTPHDRKMYQISQVLRDIDYFRGLLEQARAAGSWEAMALPLKELGIPLPAPMKTLQEVHERVAEKNGMTLDAVRQTVKRHRLPTPEEIATDEEWDKVRSRLVP